MAQELKAFIVLYNGRFIRVYPENKVNKVLADKNKEIAELKSQKAQAEDDCAYWKTMARKNAADNAVMAKQRAEALKRECHHKYKRCLAMAAYCYTNVHCIMGHRLCALADWKKEWFERWRQRWLELAEKFKEAK